MSKVARCRLAGLRHSQRVLVICCLHEAPQPGIVAEQISRRHAYVNYCSICASLKDKICFERETLRVEI